MKAYIRAISSKIEFLIVVLVAFGYFIYGSALYFLTPGAIDAGSLISEAGLRFLIVYELIVIGVLWIFLSVRGWRLDRLGLTPSIRDTAIGIGLFLAAYIAYLVLLTVFRDVLTVPVDGAGKLVAPGLSLLTVMAVSIVNPVFEEVFVCGYIITILKRYGHLSLAINVSVAIRLAYHLYQGPVGIITIIPLGLVFAYWFAGTGRLWPVVVAHGLFDFFGLVFYVKI